jgi:PAS domain S-box-containing protein
MDSILDTAPCGFLSLSDDGKILVVNATLRELLGYEVGELDGRRVDVILPPGGRVFYQTHFFPLLKFHGRVEEIYLSLRSKRGEDVPVLVNADRKDRDGAFVNDCVFLPIRQRSRYEDEILAAKRSAEAATRAKDEFLAVVSHELRTPLNAILGWARLMRGGTLDEASARRAVEIIERNAGAQAQLIEDILDFSRIVSGRLRLDVESVDLARVLEAALDVVRPAAEAKGIRLDAVLGSRVGPVSGDRDRLQQVMWNLLSNAVKFTPKGGHVHLRLERVDSYAQIAVSDNGQGIAATFLPYVFETFRQEDATITRRQGGLGLGMAITRHIVELHGGSIGVVSPGEGHGSTFTVVLPLMAVNRSEPAVGATASSALEHDREPLLEHLPSLAGLHVLVVDDRLDGRELVTAVLTRSGATVTTAGSAADAIEKVQRLEPDVLVSDIEMPNEDGYALIERVRALANERGGAIPAIALTAHARFKDRIRALAAGFQVHVTKPVEPAELVILVANLTGRNRPGPIAGPS